MHEVFRDLDSAKVGLVEGLLNEAGIATVLRNWTGSNITEIPIPAMYPAVCVMNATDVAEARRIIDEFFSAPADTAPAWTCLTCGSTVDGFLTECWSCQADRPAG